jgi:DNA-binding SARP family transcriptional activator
MLWTRPANPSLPEKFNRLMEIIADVHDMHTLILVAPQILMYAHWKVMRRESFQLMELIRARVHQENYAPLAQVMLCICESNFANYFEEAADAIVVAERGLIIAKQEGLLPWIPQLLSSKVYGALNLGENEKAKTWLHETWEMVHGSPGIGLDHYHFQAGWLAIVQGDLEAAHGHITLSLRGAQKNGGLYPEALNLLAMAQVLLEKDEIRGVETHLQAARCLIPRIQLPRTEYLYYVVNAYFALKSGQEKACLENLREAFSLAKKHGITSTVYLWRPKVMALLCAKGLEDGIEIEYVQKIIRKHHLQPDRDIRGILHWPWAIKIWMLSPFSVHVDETPLEFTQKVPRKPLALLKALIALGGQQVSEGNLIDALWPDAEGDKGQEVFEKTLTRLRKLLQVDGVLQHREGKVSLDAQRCWVDVWAFEAFLTQEKPGLTDTRSLPHLEKVGRALALYQQPFLVNDEDAAWSHVMRERVRTKYIQAMLGLSRTWSACRQWEKAILWLERGIQVEPAVEEFYQELIICFLQQDRQSEAVRVWERCRKVLRATLGVEPSAQTHNLLHTPRKSKKGLANT